MTKEHLEKIMRESAVMAGLLDAGISMAGVRSLIREFGGGRVYVPSIIDQDHGLFGLLGGKDAGRLAAYAGGDAFYIPKGKVLDSAILAEEVLAYWDNGTKSVKKVRKQFHLSERYIRKIISDAGQRVERTPQPKRATHQPILMKDQLEFKWRR